MRSLWVCNRALVQALALVLILDLNQVWSSDSQRPNFILIMLDDLGIGDLGCYGNTTLKTPHIDSLASDGLKLTHHIAAAPLCSPSRAAFLTGRYPIRTGVIGVNAARVFVFNAGSGGLPESEITFASIAQDQGYETALIGKWHLGLNCESTSDLCHHPNSHGFKYFFGFPMTNLRDCRPGHGTIFQFHLYLPLKSGLTLLLAAVLGYASGLVPVPRRALMAACALATVLTCSVMAFLWLVPYMNCVLMRNGRVVEQPFSFEDLTQRMTDEATTFIERSSSGPFLLFLSFLQVHTALFASPRFHGSSDHGLYGDSIQEVDWSVGQVLQTLDRLGLAQNTLVYLTSDQGGHLEEGTKGGFNGIYKGGKSTNFEGGIRVPGLIRWPGKIPPGLEIHELTSNMDLFPSVVQLSGAQLPQDRAIDGRPLLDLWSGAGQSSHHDFLFHYCGSRLQAVRWSPAHRSSVFKLFYFTPVFSPENSGGCFHTHVCFCSPDSTTAHDPPLLYDLSRDPSETTPLAPGSEPDYHAVVRTMEEALREHKASLQPRDSEMTVSKLLPRPWLQPCCSTFTRLCQCEA